VASRSWECRERLWRGRRNFLSDREFSVLLTIMLTWFNAFIKIPKKTTCFDKFSFNKSKPKQQQKNRPPMRVQWFSHFNVHEHHLESLVKQIAECISRADPTSLGWGPQTYISISFPGDTSHTLRTTTLVKISPHRNDDSETRGKGRAFLPGQIFQPVQEKWWIVERDQPFHGVSPVS
jgi:hypothetical protein